MFDKFMDRHIGVTNPADLAEMLKVIGVESVDELISQVIPDSIRLKKPLALPAEGMSEYGFAEHITALAAKNRTARSFIGMGYYPTAVPAVVSRNVFENPAWYTSYTPYQAEISQGRLEALLNFQTAVISLTGMQIANCSLLDEATAAAEAMLMMFALRSREAVKQGRNRLFVDKQIFPQTLDVLLTRSEPFGIELIIDDYDTYEFSGNEFGAVVQYPAANGEVRDYAAFAARAHEAGALLTAVADILSLALLAPPAEWGADIAVGSAQRLGCPMGFGGPSAGYMATREVFKRNMPGRIIGVSVDRLGTARCAWLSRCASSTSSASAPPRTSAPPRPSWPRWRDSTAYTTVPRVCAAPRRQPTLRPQPQPTRWRRWATSSPRATYSTP